MDPKDKTLMANDDLDRFYPDEEMSPIEDYSYTYPRSRFERTSDYWNDML